MKVTIFETSDVHGYLYPTLYTERNENKGFGLLKLARKLKQEREQLEGPSITIDNGDFIQGSPLSYYILKEQGKADTLIEALNRLEVDAGVLGNHEFNYGLEYLNSAIQAAQYPIVSANILNHQNKPAWGKPYTIIEKQGIKVAILGLTTQYIPHWEKPENYQGLHFESAVKCAKEYVPLLKEKADIVVVSYHGGFERDVKTGAETEVQTGENEGYQLLHEVQGIDVLLTGHQHGEYAQVVNGVPVVMPGQKGQHLGKITLEVEKTGQGIELRGATAELLPIDEVEEVDVELEKHFHSLNEEVEKWLDQPIGQVNGDMRIKDVEEARRTEHPYVEFIQKVQMHYTDCEISGTALFNNWATGFNTHVTTRDVVTNYIYPNTLAVLKVSGAELKAAIEQSAEYFVLNSDGKIAVNPDFIEPKPKMYNYDIYEGIEYIIDVAQPFGKRLVEFKYKGKDIQPDQELEVVVNQYRAVGGGDYHMFDASKIVREVTLPMNECIAEYFKEHGEVEATANHNFKVISSSN